MRHRGLWFRVEPNPNNENFEEEVCQTFEDFWFGDKIIEKFGTKCTCEDASSSFEGITSYFFTCVDECEFCHDGICAMYAIEGTLVMNEVGFFEMKYRKECYDYNKDAFKGDKICLSHDHASDTSGETVIKMTLNDVECNSIYDVSDSVCVNVDCSNLNYGSDMNACKPDTLQGPFEHFLDNLPDVDELTVGVCNSSSRVLPPRFQSIILVAQIVSITAMMCLF